jgi:hypothetical protein
MFVLKDPLSIKAVVPIASWGQHALDMQGSKSPVRHRRVMVPEGAVSILHCACGAHIEELVDVRGAAAAGLRPGEDAALNAQVECNAAEAVAFARQHHRCNDPKTRFKTPWSSVHDEKLEWVLRGYRSQLEQGTEGDGVTFVFMQDEQVTMLPWNESLGGGMGMLYETLMRNQWVQSGLSQFRDWLRVNNHQVRLVIHGAMGWMSQITVTKEAMESGDFTFPEPSKDPSRVEVLSLTMVTPTAIRGGYAKVVRDADNRGTLAPIEWLPSVEHSSFAEGLVAVNGAAPLHESCRDDAGGTVVDDA